MLREIQKSIFLCVFTTGLMFALGNGNPFAPEMWTNMLPEMHDGALCLRPVGHKEAMVKLSVQPGKWYRLDYEVFGDSEVPDLLLSYDCYMKADGKVLQEDGFVRNVPSGKWVQGTLVGQATAEELQVIVYCRREAPEGLPYYFRNFSIQETNPPPPVPMSLDLTYPEYRDMIFTSLPLEEIAGTVTTESPSREVTVALYEVDEPHTPLFVTRTDADGRFVLAGSNELSVGKYLLICKDDAGHSVKRVINKLPPSPSETAYHDGRLYHNGKPLVFSGLFKQFGSEAMVYGHARNGIRVFFSDSKTPKDILNELDLAQKYDCKIILWLRTDAPAYRQNPTEAIAAWKEKVRNLITPEIMTHPSLLAYAGEDEVGMSTYPVEYPGTISDFMESYDPHHPVWINDAPCISRERLKKFSHACQIYGIDIYPVPKGVLHAEIFEEKYLPSVGLYTDMLCEIMKDRGPVWMILQGFAWRAFYEGRTPVIYPTYEESRHMAFEAFAAGSQGNIYWGIFFTSGKGPNPGDNSRFYHELLQICAETANLEAVWLYGHPVRTGIPQGIRRFEAQIAGIQYYVVLNDTAQEQDCGLDVSDFYILPEGNKAESSNLPPYSVRVYASKPSYPARLSRQPTLDEDLERHFREELNDFLTSGEEKKND